MKVVAYSHQASPLHIEAGHDHEFLFRVSADGGRDLNVSYIVLLGDEDAVSLQSDHDLPARVIDSLYRENEALRRRVDELAFVEQIAVQQGEELERLRESGS